MPDPIRFVSFRATEGGCGVGIAASDGRIADLRHAAYASLFVRMPKTLDAMLEFGIERLLDPLMRLGIVDDALVALDSLQVLAPIPHPEKVIGAAYNYADALAERGMPPPAEPVTFFRSGRTVIGPGAPILIAPDVGNVGYEAELAVVIGRRAIDVPRSRAMDYVAGYTAHNDVSGSGMIKEDGGRFVRGKNMPGSSPLGPWFVPKTFIADPHALRVRLEIDGRVLQDGSTASMVFDIPALIEHVSHRMALQPGDIIATGTPAGVAPSHTPPAWLQVGQTVTVEVEGLGRLVNPIHAGVPYLDQA
jgi:2,4-diketo-3-deoxy-L-fuconate hydrolase